MDSAPQAQGARLGGEVAARPGHLEALLDAGQGQLQLDLIDERGRFAVERLSDTGRIAGCLRHPLRRAVGAESPVVVALDAEWIAQRVERAPEVGGDEIW